MRKAADDARFSYVKERKEGRNVCLQLLPLSFSLFSFLSLSRQTAVALTILLSFPPSFLHSFIQGAFLIFSTLSKLLRVRKRSESPSILSFSFFLSCFAISSVCFYLPRKDEEEEEDGVSGVMVCLFCLFLLHHCVHPSLYLL